MGDPVKRCFKCLCEKPLAEFYKHAAMDYVHGLLLAATPPLLQKEEGESAEKVQMPDKARAGIEVLHRVVESLLTTSRYVDEEGEATQALADLSACIADPPFKLRDEPPLPLCPFCDQRHDHCDSPGAIITGTTGCEKIDVPARARLAAIAGRASIKGEGGDV